MKRWYDITLRTLRSIESWTWLYQGRNRWIHYVNLPIGHFPPTLLNISKSSRKSGPWTWLQSESASRIDVFQEFSNFKRIPVFALQTYIARIFCVTIFGGSSREKCFVVSVNECWNCLRVPLREPVETRRLTYFCTFCIFAVAIDLIVQHAQNLLHLRNGNHQQQNRQQQLDQRYQQQQQQHQQERNRHNSESCFTRPHWIRKRNLHAAISRWNFFTFSSRSVPVLIVHFFVMLLFLAFLSHLNLFGFYPSNAHSSRARSG